MDDNEAKLVLVAPLYTPFLYQTPKISNLCAQIYNNLCLLYPADGLQRKSPTSRIHCLAFSRKVQACGLTVSR